MIGSAAARYLPVGQSDRPNILIGPIESQVYNIHYNRDKHPFSHRAQGRKQDLSDLIFFDFKVSKRVKIND